MGPYLKTARRYRWLLGAMLALVWGAGLVAAYSEYTTTFESEAIIWVQRAPPQLAGNPEDPNVTVVQTAASQQASLFNQLFLADSFLRDVVARTSLNGTLGNAVQERKALDDIRKRLRVQTLGTNLLSLSFTGRDASIAREMVDAALAVRGQRVAQARVTATSQISGLYQKQLALGQAQALDLQRQVEEFDQNHDGPLSDLEQRRRDQLRLALDYVQIRLGDLRGRIDQAVLAPALVDVSGSEFQILDEAREEMVPRGGVKPAALLVTIALAAGAVLAALLVLVGTLLADRLAGPATVGRLAPARLFATVPRVGTDGRGKRDLRAELALIAFEDAGAGSRAAGR